MENNLKKKKGKRRILHVIAQKPQDTGSGVYAKNLINKIKGYEQALVAGIDIKDDIKLPEKVEFYPVIFGGNDLDFPVVGMSDQMPYESTIYRELKGEKLDRWKSNFKRKLEEVKKEFQPDIIVSHHLYLLTSIVREVFENQKVIGVCHATDMRQLMSHDLEKPYIKSKISKLDKIFTLHAEQSKQIQNFFKIDSDRVEAVGLGYDEDIFTTDIAGENIEEINENGSKSGKEIWYVGKLAKAKGVEELLESYRNIDVKEEVSLKIAGGIGGAEGRELSSKARTIRRIELLGKVDQKTLAGKMKKGDILVLPSYYEGFPMVVIEALACGMKVVVNNIPGLKCALGPEIAKSDRIHFLPMPVLDGIDKIHEDHKIEYIGILTKKLEKVILADRSKDELNLEKFTWNGITKKYVKVIQEL